jgi:small subunit ribosomal protein S7
MVEKKEVKTVEKAPPSEQSSRVNAEQSSALKEVPKKVVEKPVKEVKSAETKKEVKPVPKTEKKVEKSVKEAKPAEKSAPKEEKVVEKPATEAKPAEEAKPKKVEKKAYSFNFKIFNKWDSNIIVADMGLRRYITLKPVLVPQSQGRDVGRQFWKSEKHIVERLITKLMVTGHRGKKHFRTSGRQTGQYSRIAKLVREAFDIIEAKTKENPVQIYVRAIERGAPLEGVTTIEYGGVRYPKAVDVSPQRRIDLALRWMTQGAYHAKAGRGKKQSTAESLAEQIMLTAAGEQKANAVQKRYELERQSGASR